MDDKFGQWEASEETVLLLKPVMSDESVTSKDEAATTEELRFSQKIAYGVGHVLNDICAAVWFSYTLLYFQVVVGMPQSLTGSLLLIGQIADAFATPVIGIYADRTGRRILWHVAGTVATVVSFPLIFMPFPGHSDFSPGRNASDDLACLDDPPDAVAGSTWIVGLYYTALIVIFQIGWATVQISHLALIPIMTPSQSERAELTTIRFSASICSSIFMYLVMWFILHVTSDEKTALGPGDAYKFRDIVLIGLAIGGAFSAWFYAVLRVPADASKGRDKSARGSSAPESGWKHYLTSPLLYQVSILYVSSRLFLTLSLVYMPLYLVENAGDEAEFLATVPLVSYIASFVASLVVKQLNASVGSKCIYLIGGVASLLGCLWIGVGLGRLNLSGELFSVAVLLGTGSSVTMVSSLCLTADFIGTHTEHGAFVYSVVTFADKLLNGIVVMIIEEFKCKDCPHYYQDVLAYACGATVFVGLIALFSMQLSLSFAKVKETLKSLRISRN